jgi:hypothetical protein
MTRQCSSGMSPDPCPMRRGPGCRMLPASCTPRSSSMVVARTAPVVLQSGCAHFQRLNANESGVMIIHYTVEKCVYTPASAARCIPIVKMQTQLKYTICLCLRRRYGVALLRSVSVLVESRSVTQLSKMFGVLINWPKGPSLHRWLELP